MKAAVHRASRVCAIVPHFRCEEWLGGAIESLLGQTRPPDAIVVVDDGSPAAPVDIVRRYDGVTLVAASVNGGPYGVAQAVVDQVRADAFVFQDADDWSAPDRLEVLLATAESTGAELVGSHEVRVIVDAGHVLPVRYPLDVNAALAERPDAFPLLHPTSLVGRDLLVRLGGFATGMRFSGDEELLRRAAHVARVVNADHFGYFRRKRSGSLTTTEGTSLRSRPRLVVQATLAARARANAAAAARGEDPDLRPWRLGSPVELRHLAGPPLPTRWPAHRRRSAARRVESGCGAPVFVIGAPRAGQQQLGWALGQHPALAVVDDPSWLAAAVAGIGRLRVVDSDRMIAGGRERTVATTALDVATSTIGRPVAAGAALTTAAPALAALWPDARFVHVVRHPDEVAASLAAAPVDDGTFHTADLAYSRWLELVDAGTALERALGADAVLRLSYDRLLTDPDGALGDVMALLGEPPHDACLATLVGLAAPAAGPPPAASPWLVATARETWGGLGPTAAADVPDRGDERLRGTARLTVGAPQPAAGIVDSFRWLVAASVPIGGVVGVISRGDPALLALDGRTGWHFPCTEDGEYAGFHPGDSTAALEQLERLRQRGATHLALPATAFWWLAYYRDLREHLACRATLVAYVEATGAVWALAAPPQVERDWTAVVAGTDSLVHQ